MAKHVAIYGVDSYGDPDAVYGSEATPPEENRVMSQDNKISVVIDPAVKAQIKQKAAELLALMPWGINIPAGDKTKYTTIKEKRAGMDDVFVNLINARPDLVPSYVSPAEVMKDLNFRKDLAEIRTYIAPIVEVIDDSDTLASSDSYNQYSAIKHTVDTAAHRNVPGADTYKAQIDPFFPGSRNAKKADKPATPAA